MGYKFLGFAVWQGAKWYLRGTAPRSKVMIGGVSLVGAAVVAGAFLAGRRSSNR
jgi:hypothetical protein